MSDDDVCLFCGEDQFFTLIDLDLDEREFAGLFCCEEARDLFDRDAVSPAEWRELFQDQAGVDIARVIDGDDCLGDEYILDYGLRLDDVSQRQAFDFINAHHSHNKAPRGWLFGFGLYNGPELVAVATVGRPTARQIDKHFHAGEVLTAYLIGIAYGFTLPPIATLSLGYDVPTVTAEITRVCVKKAKARHLVGFACSKLYAACEREIAARGYLRAITYTLVSEEGKALDERAWLREHVTKAERWDRASRRRNDVAPAGRKVRHAKYFLGTAAAFSASV